jgi:hypothetical protein
MPGINIPSFPLAGLTLLLEVAIGTYYCTRHKLENEICTESDFLLANAGFPTGVRILTPGNNLQQSAGSATLDPPLIAARTVMGNALTAVVGVNRHVLVA